MSFFEHVRFSEVLVGATFVSGLIWGLDSLFWKPQRMLKVLSLGTSGRLDKEPRVVEYARSFFPIFLIVLLVRSFLVEPFRIPSQSMVPSLLPGDFILVNKFNYGLKLPIIGYKMVAVGLPKRGDVIVFRHISNRDFIKRVVGIPGDHILYKDKVLHINGVAVPQEVKAELTSSDANDSALVVKQLVEQLGEKSHDMFVFPSIKAELVEARYHFNDVTVPAGSYFVMGDNRDASDDSRYWGFVKEEDIVGRAFAIWMSWDSHHRDVRWHRMMTTLN